MSGRRSTAWVALLLALSSGLAASASSRNPNTGTSPLVVPAAAFQMNEQASGYFFSFGGGYVQPNNVGSCFLAPVQLPANYEIVQFRAMTYDTVAEDFTLTLSRKSNGNTLSSEAMASVSTSGAGGFAIYEQNAIVQPIVSASYSYFVHGCWTTTGSTQRIYGVEIHYRVSLGDFVWYDTDGNGIQNAGEAGAPDVFVALYEDGGPLVASTVSDAAGFYEFTGLDENLTYRLRFWPPVGYAITAMDQGGNDRVDSDADPLTGETAAFTLVPQDLGTWDAGFIPSCPGPDETVFISEVGTTNDGNAYPVITLLDPNQPLTVTGYNVYRSSDASLPPGNWPLVASDVVDMDQGVANVQWIDSSGDVSPTGVWYYDIAAYNHNCLVEGPR